MGAFALAFCSAGALAQDRPSIEDARSLVGRWIGGGLGGQMEEAWSEPAGGQMAQYFWEERDAWATFEPVSSGENELVFRALSLRLEGEEMAGLIRIR